MERKTHEQMVEDMIIDLSSAVNVMSTDEDAISKMIVDRIQREHRTLQQSMIKVIAGVLVHYADASSDGRNEAAVRLCRDVRETLDSQTWAIDGHVVLPTI